MNRTFKVAKSLTRGVVVTSEKASSYQGKAVKTVVAAAVASLVAGAAMAATTPVDDIKLGADGALVKDSTNVTAAVTGTATVTYGDKKTDKWDADKYNHTGTTTVTLDGGKIVVDATGYTDSQEFTMGKGSVTGNGTIAVTAGTKDAKLFLSKSGENGGELTLKKADITLAGTTAAAAFLEAQSNVTIDEGSLNFTLAGDAKTGTGSLISVGAITLGKAADEENAATAVAINVAKDVTAKISSDGKLELTNAAFANAGKLTLKGSQIALDSDFDDSTNAGTTVFDGATTLSKNFTGSVVEMAAAATNDAKQVFTDNVTVNAGAAFAADKLTISKDSTLSTTAAVTGENAKAAGSLNVSEAIVKAGTHSFSGTETFGKLTIGDAAATTATAAKITVAAGTLDVSDTLTVKGNAAKGDSSDGTATLELTGGVTTLKTASIGDFGVLSVTSTAKLNVTDTLTVAGSAANKTAAVTLAGENATIANLVVNANGTVTASSDDTDLTITNLTVGNGGSFTVDGSYAMVEKLSVAKADTTNSKAAGTFTLESGTLETTGDQIFAVDNTKTTLAEKLSLKDGLTTGSFTGGELVLVDETYNGKAIQYTLSDWQTVKAELGSSTDLVLLYGTLVGATGDDGVTAKASFNEAQTVGYTGKSAVLWKYGKADAEATVSRKDLTVGSIEFTKADGYTGNLDSVSIKAGSSTTVSLLSDADQQVFIGAVDKDGKPVAVTLENESDSSKGSFAFGDEGDYDNVGVVTNKVIAKTDVTVYDDFTFDAVELDGGSITVAGRMAAKDITSKTNEATTVQESGTLVLAGTAADPKKGEFGQQVAANVQIGNGTAQNPVQNGALFVVGTADDEKAAQVYQAAHHLDNTLWVGQAVKFNGSVSFAQQNASGTWNGHEGVSGEKTVAIDLAALAQSGYTHSDKAVITGLDANNAPEKLVLANLQQVSKDTLGYNDYREQYFLNVGTAVSNRVDFGTEFYQSSAANVINGNAYFVVDEDTVKEVKALGLNSFGAVESAVRNLEFGQNEIADTVIFDLYGSMSTNAYLLAADEAYDKYLEELQKAGKYPTGTSEEVAVALYKLEQEFYAPYVAELVKAEHAATNMAALGGAFTTALDINDQVTAAVSRRTSAQRTEGFTPWVDVFGTTNEAKRLYGNGAGYEADIYGAVLGFDYTAACGGTLGVAFNVGQADGNSVGSGAKVDNDADFYGVSLYGVQTFGDFNVKADLGYTQVSNDLSTNNVLGSYKESLDANVFTFGLGTEYLAKFGALNVTPHAGIRLSRIDMDDSKYGADYDAMTVYQLPLGVAFSGNFDVNGWKLAPMVDLSVVPAFGDKDAVATYTGGIQSVTRVVDTNPIQATLGVSAQNGAWTFGLNYGLTAGGDDRMNNAFNANLRYSF
ncbi:autotransporter domain-containing protein [Sutterella wadsworthensis]|uniref:autotransporter domain-containing protein n=1 Tax=Sutterella wadsworthensis TaxID=40545 RepID=UPI00352002AD